MMMERTMKRFLFALALAFAVIGGTVAATTAMSVTAHADPNGGGGGN